MKKQAFDLKDIKIAVKTIKTAILRSRYMAARKANFEHLKLYFYVGADVSANSRNGTWGTGAIAAISERLSQELPGKDSRLCREAQHASLEAEAVLPYKRDGR